MNARRAAVDPAHALLWQQSAAALSCLVLGPFDARRVHAARKALKQARAALRLLRPCLDAAVYRRENLALRDAGRALAPLRDARVLLDAADRLRAGARLDAPGHRLRHRPSR